MTETKKPEAPKRLVATFQGRVQGVGFRFTTVEIARHFEVTGFVHNLLDGSVKIVAEGIESELLKFLRAVREAHIYRYVTAEDIHWTEARGEFESFTIRYT